jgi:RNA polymerase sigma-70 factor (ECF subfamily)
MTMVSESDADLWARVNRGDRDAFALLFRRHSRTIYNYCFRRTGDWSQAEDLTSVVFLEAWRRREVELPADKIVPWLYGVATNVLRNSRRSLRRHDAALRRLPVGPGGRISIDDPAGRLEDERRMRSILTQLATMPKRDQDVFVLCVWQDLTYEDAAVVLGIPVGTVRSRLSRVRRILREPNPAQRT